MLPAQPMSKFLLPSRNRPMKKLQTIAIVMRKAVSFTTAIFRTASLSSQAT